MSKKVAAVSIRVEKNIPPHIPSHVTMYGEYPFSCASKSKSTYIHAMPPASEEGGVMSSIRGFGTRKARIPNHHRV
jgi:hypothetical protein